MSSSCLIRWIEQLLFGDSGSLPLPPLPAPLQPLVLRMEADRVPWSHILRQGGFTSFPYQVHGDLNSLTDYLEQRWLPAAPAHEPPLFKTRAVAKFWHELQQLLAQRDEGPLLPELPEPAPSDDALLQELLAPPSLFAWETTRAASPRAYQSAAFWGEVARRFIYLSRSDTPPSTTAAAAPALPSDRSQRVLQQLYEVTCVSRGQWFDPLTLHLVHHTEYVNAAHWQTPDTLEAFLQDRPTHPLARSVQALLRRTVDRLLQGEAPFRCPRLEALLHNVRVIHEAVEQVPHRDTLPPRLIDVFQRLLALSHRDALWEKEVPVQEEGEKPQAGVSLLHLTEQLRIAQKERRVLWRHLTARDSEFDAATPRRICSRAEV